MRPVSRSMTTEAPCRVNRTEPYQRFLGRPFAGHRDSVSELVADGLEKFILGATESPPATSFLRRLTGALRVRGVGRSREGLPPAQRNIKKMFETH